MREIKYKAFIKTGKLKGKILPVVRIEWESYSNGEVKALNNIWCDPGEDKLDIPYLPKDVNLLEFTGSKDQDKTEVYEYDILKIRDLHYLVIFRFSEWDLNCINKNMWSDPYFYSWVSKSKKIGNLFTNPELVKHIKPEVYESNPELLEVSE